MTQENKQAQVLNEAQWVEDETERRSKETWIVWLLWFFFGGIGAHRFYMGKTGSGVGMLVLNLLGWATTVFLIGFLFLGVYAIWWLVDAFLISGWLAEDKIETRREVERDLAVRKGLHG